MIQIMRKYLSAVRETDKVRIFLGIKGDKILETEIHFEIPCIRLSFTAELLEDTILPETKAAALRGGMGMMLLRQNCVTDQNCGKCSFRESCVVTHTFYSHMSKKPSYVTGAGSVGYLIECRDRRTEYRKGSSFSFTLTLFGESIVFFNLYLQAFCQLGMAGLGKHHSRFRIREVLNTRRERLVWGNQVDMRRYKIYTVGDYITYRRQILQKKSGLWTITFLTPLCMKHQKNFLQDFSGEAVVKGAARRMQMLNYYTGTEALLPVFSRFPETVTQFVRTEQVERYSGTQDSHMTLRGITGHAVMKEIPEECMDYLIAGELTQIGKNTSFGFGKYILGRGEENNTDGR